jgi:hypothetical protein
MARNDPAAFRLTVLNPGGRDPEQHFPDGAGESAQPHPPTNFHAYAACTNGSFHRDAERAIDEKTPVLLLLRGDFITAERALTTLQKHHRFVAVALKETGLHQFADQLRDPARLLRFRRIVRQANGCLAPTPEAADFYRTIRGSAERVAFIPTPYPIDDRRWNFSRPITERAGIFIGTREWKVPSRNHLGALLIARRLSEQTGQSVTLFNLDGRRGTRLIASSGLVSEKLHRLDKPLSYPNYLREVGRHKIVFQLDTSFVPGQVAGDALLCRVPCVGGNGAVDRLGFPETCGLSRTIGELEQAALRLLTDEHTYQQAVADIEKAVVVSFKVVAEKLKAFFAA